MKSRSAKRQLRRRLMGALQSAMERDHLREISGLDELISALKAEDICQEAMLMYRFGQRVVNTVTRIIARRVMKKRYRKLQAERTRQSRVKPIRISAAPKPRAIRPPKVKKPQRMSRNDFPYVVMSQSYATLHTDFIIPLLRGQKSTLPSISCSGVFSVYLGRYEGGGLQGNRFVGGAYVGGVIMKIRWRWTGNKFSWKIREYIANDGTVATWNRAQVWKKSKLPITLQQSMRDTIGKTSHMAQGWQDLAIAI